MVTERIIIGKIDILEDGRLEVRNDTIIERDGRELIRLFHRRVLDPSLTNTETDERLRRVITAVWTSEVITEFERKRRQALEDDVTVPPRTR
jgi:hypothetical protein